MILYLDSRASLSNQVAHTFACMDMVTAMAVGMFDISGTSGPSYDLRPRGYGGLTFSELYSAISNGVFDIKVAFPCREAGREIMPRISIILAETDFGVRYDGRVFDDGWISAPTLPQFRMKRALMDIDLMICDDGIEVRSWYRRDFSLFRIAPWRLA